MIRTVIIDDELHCIEQLKKLIKASAVEFEIIACYTCLQAASKNIEKMEFDLLLLDIQVKDELAFDFLQKLNTINFEIIFITAYQDYAIRAFKFCAVDYLLKPIDQDDFDESARRVTEKIKTRTVARNLDCLLHNLEKQNTQKKISLPTQQGLFFIEIQEIIRCQADVNYTHFHLFGNQKITVSKSLKFYEELLSDCNFFRIHNSHLINLNHLKKYTRGKGGYVTMADNTRLDVSTRRKEEFLKRI